MVSLLTLGEGWHNYHHVFPWDYKTAEIGGNRINPTTRFIDFMARIGWAYDLKTAPMSMVKKRVERTGDGSHELWGWGDKDMTTSDKDLVCVINSKAM
jgi:stearoyl-CoA desaturase (delta-9 desaturase)